ncbi:hypothetical protein [Paraburkholderia ferrariae]|uniref:hypothetical protein n=1 Tax=Paraburkholderia ferrariae TaxID=386056 RepID=UPI00048252ED|nr:hypothetical protein [Paraburkholderia ferrariae]
MNEPKALALGASKSGDVREAADPDGEWLQASLREARGEDDPRGLAWIEEVREAWWRRKLARLPRAVVDAFLRARRALLRVAARLAAARRSLARKA